MNTLIFCLLFSFCLRAQEIKPQLGILKKTLPFEKNLEFGYTNFTSHGYPIILEEKTGMAYVYNENGEVQKIHNVKNKEQVQYVWSLQGLDDDSYHIQVLRAIDKNKGIIEHQVGSGSRTFSDATEIGLIQDLGDDRVALLGLDSKTNLRIMNESGKTLASKDLPKVSWIKATKNKDLLVADEDSINLYDKNLTLKFIFKEEGKKFNYFNYLETQQGNFVVLNNNKELIILDSKGTPKSRITGGDNFRSLALTPDGNIAALNSDNNLYFIGQDGSVKYKHLHDSASAWSVTSCGNKMAYWNKTEIVFVDLKGNELGTLPMPKAQISGVVLTMPNNSIIAHETHKPKVIYFIKCP